MASGVRGVQGLDGGPWRRPVRPHRRLSGRLHEGAGHREGGPPVGIHLQLPLQAKRPGGRGTHYLDQGWRIFAHLTLVLGWLGKTRGQFY